MAKLRYVLLAGVLLDVVSLTSLHHISKRTYGYGGRMRGGYRGGYGGFGGYRGGGYRGFGGGYRGLGGGGYGGGLNALTTALYGRILDGMYGGGFGGGFGGVQYIYVPVYVPVDDGTVVIVEEGGGTDFGNGGPGIIDTGGGEVDIGGIGNEELLMYQNSDGKATTRVKVATQPQRVRIGRERVVQKSTELGLGRTYAFTPPRRTKGRAQQG
ncbi:ctenidin-3 [Rhipicephalus sanguineus]|uniref:ctenidin-3 n=1 Tax=Rhipicephalus sanguineus TaxID=34632 RepID=UPI0018941FDC|nr:ctenidin-3 [Rhipicephalus sanguineus]